MDEEAYGNEHPVAAHHADGEREEEEEEEEEDHHHHTNELLDTEETTMAVSVAEETHSIAEDVEESL